MPAPLASLACAAFIVWLLSRDLKENPTVSHALWLPLSWMFFDGTRSLAEWVYGFDGGSNIADNFLDRDRLTVQVIIGLAILLKRSVSWSSAAASNSALALFFAYALSSLMWSEIPLATFKQWHRLFGYFVMVFVVFTEKEPEKAWSALFKRYGYIAIPMSVLFIKYYPALGRRFSDWNGYATNVGVGDDKNSLGFLSMVMILFFVSSFLVKPKKKEWLSSVDGKITFVLLAMAVWLLLGSDTSTAVVGVIVGVSVLLFLEWPVIRRSFTGFLMTACVIFALGLVFTDLKDTIIDALGEDTTLTGRTELWDDLSKIPINPILGTGLESFWTGKRLAALWQKHKWHPTQAHNGYYEIYLNLGIIGLVLQVVVLFSCYAKARQRLPALSPGDKSRIGQYGLASFRFAFLLAFIGANWTTGCFKSCFLYFVFMTIVFDYVPQRQEPRPRSLAQVSVRREKALVHSG